MGRGVQGSCPVVAPSRQGGGIWVGAPREQIVEYKRQGGVVQTGNLRPQQQLGLLHRRQQVENLQLGRGEAGG